MVYITENTEKMAVLRSKMLPIDKMVLKNQTDKTLFSFDLKEDEVEYSKNTITIDLSNIKDSIKVSGQYNYYLYYLGEVVESGILQVGEFKTKIETYNTKSNIIQYNK